MSDWFRNLERREQWVVVGGGLVLAAVLFLLLVVRPLYAGTARMAQRVEDKQELVVWMRSVAPELSAAGPIVRGEGSSSGDSLVLVVADTAAASDLRQYLKQNQPAGDNSIRVRFEAAPFDQLVQWLGALQLQHGVRIDSASFDGGVQPGLVTASLVLERPSA